MTICLLPPPVLTRPMPSTAILPALHRSETDHACSDGVMEIEANPLGRKGVPGVGTRIRAARKRRGLTIRALAELADIDKGSLTGWELEIRDLTLTQLGKVAAALDVPPESLLPDALPLPPEVFAASFECPSCHMQAGVLMTAMSPPRKATQDRTNERNAR